MSAPSDTPMVQKLRSRSRKPCTSSKLNVETARAAAMAPRLLDDFQVDLISYEVAERLRADNRKLLTLARGLGDAANAGDPSVTRKRVEALKAALTEHVALLDGVLEALSEERPHTAPPRTSR